MADGSGEEKVRLVSLNKVQPVDQAVTIGLQVLNTNWLADLPRGQLTFINSLIVRMG